MLIGCFDVIDTAAPIILSEVEKMKGRDIGTPRAFHIADYGTADAGTSLGLLTSMIEEVRNQLGPEKEVVLHYEDQLTNEWRR